MIMLNLHCSSSYIKHLQALKRQSTAEFKILNSNFEKKKFKKNLNSSFEKKTMNLLSILSIAILLKLAAARLNQDQMENTKDKLELKDLRQRARIKHTGAKPTGISVIKVTNGHGIQPEKYDIAALNGKYKNYKPNPETKRMYPSISRSKSSKHWLENQLSCRTQVHSIKYRENNERAKKKV